MGYDGAVYLMGWTGGCVLLALCLAPYLRKFGKFTMPAFIGDRYYSQSARSVAVPCAVFVCFTYVARQMQGVGVVFFLLGAWRGGMKGITYTQVAQYCVLIFAYLVSAMFVAGLITATC